MINLSQLARESPEIPIFEKFRSYIISECYVSESIVDFVENAPNIVLPWHRKLSAYATLRRPDIVIMMFYNVGLREIDMADVELPDFCPDVKLFELHDDSGSTLAQWGFSPRRSFEQAQYEEGLKEDDYVHQVFAAYSLRNCNVSILDLTKDEFGRQSKDKDSLVDKVKESLPKIELPRWGNPLPN